MAQSFNFKGNGTFSTMMISFSGIDYKRSIKFVGLFYNPDGTIQTISP